MSDWGAISIAEALQLNDTLTSLNLGTNGIGVFISRNASYFISQMAELH